MTNELTVRVQNPVIPAMNWNEEEVRKNLDEMLAVYTGMVYTPDSIKRAKEDRAKVNNWDKQLGSALTAAKRLYMKPLEDFQTTIRELQGQCKQVSGAIDEQVKAVENAEKEEKRSSLMLVYRDSIEELESLIPFEKLFDPKWLNKTVPLSTATKALRQKVENVRSDMDFIRETFGEDAEACIIAYQKSLNLSDAKDERKRREKARADLRAAEAARAEAERVRAAAPVIAQPTAEEREMKARAAAATQAKMLVTSDGRLDIEAMQAMQDFPQAEEDAEAPAEVPKRYRFWVEFTEADIEWFKNGAKERHFRFGCIK